MKRFVALTAIALLALTQPAGASHPKVLIHDLHIMGHGVGHLHVEVVHWQPNVNVTWRVCSRRWPNHGLAACDVGYRFTTSPHSTGKDGSVRQRMWVYAGPVGDGQCGELLRHCSIVVMTEQRAGHPDLSSAVTALINP